ncbi:MAG: hypothetical protein HY902_02460 [Deltaproteobacteria bacterium]|nr:hypothetical protein [Deltaproteobacteria bacterium]
MANQAPDNKGSGAPRWLVLVGLGVGVLAAGALGVWLLMGGTATVMRWLPEGVAKTLGEKPGEGKRVEQKLTDYPGDKAAPAGDSAEDDGQPPSAEDLEDAMAPLRDLAVDADAAIAKVRQGGAEDLTATAAAEKAIQTLRTAAVGEASKKAKKAAEDRRKAMVLERVQALAAAKRLSKATHMVREAPAKLHQAADDSSPATGTLDDGVLVWVHLDTGKGWSRVDVLSGAASGKSGYVLNSALTKLKGAK